MARRKQRLPARANGGIAHKVNSLQLQLEKSKNEPNKVTHNSQDEKTGDLEKQHQSECVLTPMHLIGVEIYSPVIAIDGNVDVAEICLRNVIYSTSSSAAVVKAKGHSNEEHLQVRLRLLSSGSNHIGGQYTFSAEDVRVELVEQLDGPIDSHALNIGEQPCFQVIMSGYLDGPDACISGLVYLFKQGFITLKPYFQSGATASLINSGPSCRLRIGITKKAFDSSNGLLDSTKYVWNKNMQRVMEWLRPELHTDEAIYAVSAEQLKEELAKCSLIPPEIFDSEQEDGSQDSSKERLHFNPAALYEAMRPDQNEPLLDSSLPELLPKLRPYQSRAAHWMVKREKGLSACDYDSLNSSSSSASLDSLNSGLNTDSLKWPLSVRVDSTDGKSAFFYNPFSGCVSREPFETLPDFRGGILADEMGLGKTVELLACILTNPYRASTFSQGHKNAAAARAANDLHAKLMKRKSERVDCPCGAEEEDGSYVGFWVQCDFCDSWQHASCVGFGLELQKGESLGQGRHTQNYLPHTGNSGTRREKKRRKSGGGKVVSASEDETRIMEEFVCGTCAELIGSVQVQGVCGATLIVCPTPILGQWQEEIARHTKKGSLKVIVYEGVQRGCSTSGYGIDGYVDRHKHIKVVGSHELAAADIVLTTYDILRADLSHDLEGNDDHQRSMRFRKRYPVVPTPLTRLHWWRICLDEAQMVESSTARATEMALRLDAQIRWCISGTPIQRSLDDLYGLLKFLGVQPFDDLFWWTKVLKQPYEEKNPGAIYFAHSYLRKFMWRSSKAHVSNELGLPPQEERTTWLKFSPIEAHFYRRQHERCARKAQEVMAECKGVLGESNVQAEGNISDVDRTQGTEYQRDSSILQPIAKKTRRITHDRPLTHAEAAKLLNPLLSLRQACCHPQVGSSGLRSLQKSPMTMDEILKVLVEKAKTEGEEAQRNLIGALNGLAALAVLEQNIPAAVTTYREALSFTEDNAEDFRVDPLQKLHTLHNLDAALKMLGKRNSSNDGSCSIQISCNSEKRHGSKEFDNLHAVKKQRSETCTEAEGENFNLRETNDPGSAGDNINMASVPRENDVIADEEKKSNACHVPRTLRDDLLVQQCQDIRAKYMSSFYLKLSAARQEYRSTHDQVCNYMKELEDLQATTWWLDSLASVGRQGKELVKKVKDTLLEKDFIGLSKGHDNASSLALRFGDMNGLRYILKRELDAIENHRNESLDRLTEIDETMDNPSAENVERAAHCSVCDSNQSGPPCAHCEMDKLFQLYENRLFLLKSISANVGGVVSLEDAFVAQERMRIQKRNRALKNAAGSLQVSGSLEEELGRNRRYNRRAFEITRSDVSRAPSETETILKIIQAYAKQTAGRDAVAAGKKHLQAFEAMRKEFAQAGMLTIAHRGVLSALDELNMAITRLRLRFPGEDVSNAIEDLFKLHPEEIPQRNAQLTGDRFVACEDLSRAKGQLRYLKGLAISRKRSRENENAGKYEASSQVEDGDSSLQGRLRSSDAKHVGFGSSDEETCPVCHEMLGIQFMVLPCGHILCCKCMMAVAERAPNSAGGVEQKRIMCPSCRYRTYLGNIAFVDSGADENSYSQTLSKLQNKEEDAESSLLVRGSYGTKMEAVTRRILQIKLNDPSAKFLIFSTWNDVLDVVEHTLSANNISFVRAKGSKNLDTAIRKFKGTSRQDLSNSQQKNADKPVQVLLLLIQQGANGLNLVEAQHVILIEPLLNPGAESQAVNRVHRIGQHHATFVHKFLIKETVEESIYKLSELKAHSSNGVSNALMGKNKQQDFLSLTLNDLNMLFTAQACDDNLHAQTNLSETSMPSRSLRDLPPAAAAAAAAEARLKQALKNGQ